MWALITVDFVRNIFISSTKEILYLSCFALIHGFPLWHIVSNDAGLPKLASIDEMSWVHHLVNKYSPEEDKVLFIFKRKVYPEINPIPEKRIIERLRQAIFSENATVDPRTVVLISLANGARLLGEIFGKKEIKTRKSALNAL